MSPADALGRALKISTQQLLLLRDDDTDGYTAGLPEQEAACRHVAALDVAQFGDAERGQLERLTQTNEEILEAVTAWLGREGANLSTMRQARAAAQAYGAAPPPRPIRSIGA